MNLLDVRLAGAVPGRPRTPPRVAVEPRARPTEERGGGAGAQPAGPADAAHARPAAAAPTLAENIAAPDEAKIRETISAGNGPTLGEATLGVRITLEGLARYYDVLPGLKPTITNVAPLPDRMTFKVSWLDGDGKEVAGADRALTRHEDGAFELHLMETGCEPEYRGRGLAAHLLLQDAALLASLSKAPRTRLTLRAGGQWDPRRATEGRDLMFGTYVWPCYGFELAELSDARSKLAYYGRGSPYGSAGGVRELDLLHQGFKDWVEEKAASGAIPPTVATALLAAGDATRNVQEIAHLTIRGLKFEVELLGRKTTCDVGKAFLLSRHAPDYDVALYVHPFLAGEGPGLAYARRAIARAKPIEPGAPVDRAAVQRELALDPDTDPRSSIEAFERHWSLTGAPDRDLMNRLLFRTVLLEDGQRVHDLETCRVALKCCLRRGLDDLARERARHLLRFPPPPLLGTNTSLVLDAIDLLAASEGGPDDVATFVETQPSYALFAPYAYGQLAGSTVAGSDAARARVAASHQETNATWSDSAPARIARDLADDDGFTCCRAIADAARLNLYQFAEVLDGMRERSPFLDEIDAALARFAQN